MKDVDSSLEDIGVHPSLFRVSIPVVKLVVAFLAPFGTYFALRGFTCFHFYRKALPGKITTSWSAVPSAQMNSRTVICSLLADEAAQACLFLVDTTTFCWWYVNVAPSLVPVIN